MRFDTPPEQLTGDALHAVRRQVANSRGDLGWFRDAAPIYIGRCDRQSPIEPLMAVALTGAIACGANITFQPQVPTRGYVIDFALVGPYDGWYGTHYPTRKVAVEVDGLRYHTDTAADLRRERHLEVAGWAVARFAASDLLRALYSDEYRSERQHGGADLEPPDPPYEDLLTHVIRRLRLPLPPHLCDGFTVDRDRHGLPTPLANIFG